MFVHIRSAAFVIVVTQKLVLQQSKNITAKCTETLSPPPFIQYLLGNDDDQSDDDISDLDDDMNDDKDDDDYDESCVPKQTIENEEVKPLIFYFLFDLTEFII